MAVVVAKDIILFIAFAAAFGIMKQVMMDVDDTVDATVDATVDRTFTRTVIRSLGLPALDILTSMTVGSLAGLCLASPYFLFPRLSALHQRRTLTTTTTASQPQQTQQQQAQQQQQQQQQPTAILKMVHRLLLESPRVAFPVLAAGCLRFLADAFGTEVLLTCVSAGVTLGHLEPSWIQPAGHGSLSSPPTHAPLFNWSGALPVISTIFFGLVGANLQVDKIGRNLGPALLLFGFRLVGVWIGCFVGGRVGGVGLLQTPLTRKYLWMTMITQAGIALGLTRTVVSRYPASPWAQDFEALMAGQVIANLVAGPPALRQALRLAGEGAIEVQDDDAVHLSFNQHRDGAEITQRSAIQNKAGGGGGPEA